MTRRDIGMIGLILAVGGVLYFAVFFDISVDTGDGRSVVNLGRMQDRQVGLIIFAVMFIASLLDVLLSAPTPRAPATSQDWLKPAPVADSARAQRVRRRFVRGLSVVLVLFAVFLVVWLLEPVWVWLVLQFA